MIVKAAFISGVCILAATQAGEVLPQINAAYAFKDLTVSGLLLAAVVYLHRWLNEDLHPRADRHHADDGQGAICRDCSDGQGTVCRA
jgi:hypothetical protein